MYYLSTIVASHVLSPSTFLEYVAMPVGKFAIHRTTDLLWYVLDKIGVKTKKTTVDELNEEFINKLRQNGCRVYEVIGAEESNGSKTRYLILESSATQAKTTISDPKRWAI